MRTTNLLERAVGVVLVLVAVWLALVSVDFSHSVAWNTQWGGSAGGPVLITITHPGGRVEKLEAASSQEAERIIDRRGLELWDQYDMDARRAKGRLILLGAAATGVAGLILLVLSFLRPASPRRRDRDTAEAVG